MTTTHPAAQRALQRAQRAGSRCTTPRGAVHWCLTHPEAWDDPAPPRPSLRHYTPAEREDRRAAADPAFRRRLLRRLRREVELLLRAPFGREAEYRSLAARIVRISPRATVPPLRIGLQRLGGSREQRYALAKRLGVRLAPRRGKDWTVRATRAESHTVEEAGESNFKGGGACRNPGAAIRAGYKVEYTRATYETHVRSVSWIDAEGRAYWLLHETTYTLPAGEWSRGDGCLLRDGQTVDGLDLWEEVQA